MSRVLVSGVVRPMAAINVSGGLYGAVYGTATSATTYTGPWLDTNPVTGVPWTQADWNSLIVTIVMENAGAQSNGANLRWYEVYADFEYSDPPATPTGVIPAAGSTVTTDIPTLQATLAAHPQGILQRVEWQLATDASFTANVRTFTQAASALKASGTYSDVLPNASQLFQATWYIRARALDATGMYGSYSAAQSFVVSHPPSTAGHTPTGNTTVDYGSGSVTFGWTFTDASPVDSQTAYRVIVERNSDGAAVADTGVVSSTNQFATVAIGSGFKDVTLRWRVIVYDTDNVASAASANQLFVVSDKPVVAFTAPAAGATIAAATVTATWTFTASAGRTQAQRRIKITRNSDSTVMVDTGLVLSSSNTYTSTPLPNNTAYTILVQTIDNVGLQSADQTRTFTIAYTAPAAPTFTVNLTPFSQSGYVRLDWSASASDANWTGWKVYYKKASETTWTLAYTTATPSVRVYDLYLLASGEPYNFAITQTADLGGGTILESALPGAPTNYTPVSEDYWLLHPTDSTKHFHFYYVVDDSFNKEIEQETLNLIGRGRKVDYGTTYGYTGTLVTQLRDISGGQTARQQRLALEALRDGKTTMYLRTPFGDIWQVVMTDITIQRIPGVGAREFSDVTVPYSQVA